MNTTRSPFSEIEDMARRSPYKILDVTKPIAVFGAGSFARSAISALRCSGFQITNLIQSKPEIASAMGLPILDWNAMAREDPDRQIVISILNRETPYDNIMKMAMKCGLKMLHMPWEMYEQLADEFGWQYWLSRRETILSQLSRLDTVAARLADQESYEILKRVVMFRLGLDPGYSSFRSPEAQYFNVITLPLLQKKSICYVDCGAFDGETCFEMLRLPDIDCKHAILLEPDPDNYAVLINNVQQRRRQGQNHPVICLPIAASNKCGSSFFERGKGESARLSALSNTTVTTARLDDLLLNMPVDFIKLDIEGEEANALRGAEQILRTCRPGLALSLYHKPDDLWELPELLFQLCPDYKFFVRQHFYNSFDLVLYCVPDTARPS